MTAKTAGPDGWISLLLPATVYASTVVVICISLARRFPSQVFTEYLPEVVGKIPGKVLALLYTGMLIHIISVMVVEGAQFIQSNFLTETPVIVLQLVLVSVAVYGSYLGVEVIARHNEIVFPIFILSLSALILLIAKDINLSNFLPIMENGIVPVLKGSMTPGVWRGEVFIILWLYPYLNQKEEAYQAGLGMILIATVLSFTVVATTIGVFGDLYTAHLVYPVNILARYISVASILERLELIIVIIWVAGVIVKLAIFFHTAGIAAASTLGLKNYRTMLIPVALSSTILGNVFYGTYVQIVDFLSKVWP
ncbi:MAG: endospore germination permease, partial [Syntrophomonadaceae bacterium]|nr:endospore germination permease [Syntrophomonadaceae bacterium]